MSYRSSTRALVVAAAVLLTACGGRGEETVGADAAPAVAASSAPAEDIYNDVDMEFVDDMKAHHDQTVTAAELLLQEGASGPVLELAEELRRSQEAELEQLEEMLAHFAAGADESGGHDHGGPAPKKKAIGPDELAALDSAVGPEAERQFLQLMVRHLAESVEASEFELLFGDYPPAHEVAEQVRTDHAAWAGDSQRLLSGR